MREIKFRVWDNGIMKKFARIPTYIDSEGNLYKDNDPYGLDMSGRRSISPMPNCVVMQWTGLHDKNGKEIYEGDIVRYYLPGETDQDPEMEFTEEVSFVDGCFVVDGYTPAYVITDWKGEVIGNIHQDSEFTKP